MCGAVAASEATRCEHCNARLATVACPSCFGMMFLGQQFCPHCGAKADRQDSTEPARPEPCPRCQTDMEAVILGGSKVRECPQCEGIWTDAETLRQICTDQEKQAAVLGMPTQLPANEGVEIERQIRYLRCPVCGDMMNRLNFANFSGVIVDVCRLHGTWFDRDELRRIVEFIRAARLAPCARAGTTEFGGRPAAGPDGSFPRRQRRNACLRGGCPLRRLLGGRASSI